MPTETSSAAVIGTNSPTGSISVVTTQNVAMPTAVTASQECRAPEAGGGSGVEDGEKAPRVMSRDSRKGPSRADP
ncbi:hypothetical protein ADE_14650 [Achromobacter denitrificans]|nr:hypothetical protein ADE_14650 [Achromobacter denitrificans]